MKLLHGLIGKTSKLWSSINYISNWLSLRIISNKVKRISAVAIIGISVVLAVNLGVAIVTTMSMIVPLSIGLIVAAWLFLPKNNKHQAPQLLDPPSPCPNITDLPLPSIKVNDKDKDEAINTVEEIYQAGYPKIRRRMLEESLKR